MQARSITGGVHVHSALQSLPVPRQVPAVPRTFTDRQESVAALTAWIREHADSVRAVAVHGVPGVGKTTLAARLLDDLREMFPAGQLYADLHGSRGPGPTSLLDVLGQLLRSLYAGPLPSGFEERAAWWRSATASCEQPLAVLLDNVANADQVRALMPGGRGHLVLATSREPLHDLARDGALIHPLHAFTPPAALEYLTHFAGEARIAQDRAAADRIAVLSDGLPLALGLVGGEIAAHPDRPLGPMANLLEVAHHITRTSHCPPPRTGTAVTSSLTLAYTSLPPATADLCRCLGLLFTPDIDTALTATIADLTPEAAEQHLQTLHSAGLLTVKPHADPVRGTVYTLHDETRAYARAHAEERATDGEIQERLRRVLDYLLATLTAAEHLLTPQHRRLTRTYHYPPAETPFSDEDGATAWLQAYAGHFLPAVRTAAAAALHATTWQLTHALWCWLRLSHDYAAWSESHALAADAARADGDCLAQCEILGTWGIGLRGEHRYDEAIEKFTEVLRLARDARDGRGEAQALHEIGTTHLAGGRRDLAGRCLHEARELRQDLLATAEEPEEQRAHRRSVALTDICLGELALDLGQEAVARLTEARDTLLNIQDPLDAARARAWLGRAHALAGNATEAESEGRTAIRELTALGTPRGVARGTELLGRTLLETGRLTEARDLLQQAQALFALTSPGDAERLGALLQRLS